MLPVRFVLITGFTANNGAISTIVGPGLFDENECHKLALKLNAPKHGCFDTGSLYNTPMSPTPVQDTLQDKGVIR